MTAITLNSADRTSMRDKTRSDERKESIPAREKNESITAREKREKKVYQHRKRERFLSLAVILSFVKPHQHAK
jgi:hypothetical protein